MRDELTQRERDDMRDLLVAGAQRIRPFNWDAVVASVAVTVVLVAGAGVVAVLYGSSLNRGVVGAPTSSPTASPGPTQPKPPAYCRPVDFPIASLRGATPPARGEHVTLELDPCLTVNSLMGSYEWIELQGIDADMIQGFQSVLGVEPWIAPLADGSGRCILIRGEDRNSWEEVACDSAEKPATVLRAVGGSHQRFVIENDAIVVYGS